MPQLLAAAEHQAPIPALFTQLSACHRQLVQGGCCWAQVLFHIGLPVYSQQRSRFRHLRYAVDRSSQTEYNMHGRPC